MRLKKVTTARTIVPRRRCVDALTWSVAGVSGFAVPIRYGYDGGDAGDPAALLSQLIMARQSFSGYACVGAQVPARFPLAALSVVLAMAGLLGASPSVQGHPYHPQFSNEILADPDAVDFDTWLAQSILPASSFFVSRVSVFVNDTGTSGPLTISIRADASGSPSAADLASGGADGPSIPGWVDVDLSPYIELLGNTRYWIVARSTASSGQGYDWWDSGSPWAYPDGNGAGSSDGINWGSMGIDFSFRVYGFLQPGLSFSAVAASPEAQAGGFVTFTVNLTNTGAGPAEAIWVNVTLPPEMSYVSDDAANAGGLRTAPSNFTFANVGPGVHTFNLTVAAGAGVANGTTAVTSFHFDGTDHNGIVATRAARNVAVTIWNPGTAGGPPWSIGWGWIVVVTAAVGLGALVLVLWRRRASDVTVDDVFVGDRGGVLLAHGAYRPTPQQDSDIFVGMLRAVQDFVRDSFNTGTGEEMRALEFGERTVLIERGANHFIAVVYRGSLPARAPLLRRIRSLSSEIDQKFGDILAHWDGSVEAVEGITALISKVSDR